jgi:hypothetical protein
MTNFLSYILTTVVFIEGRIMLVFLYMISVTASHTFLCSDPFISLCVILVCTVGFVLTAMFTACHFVSDFGHVVHVILC